MNEFTKSISIKKLFFNPSFFNSATKLSWLESILFSVMIGLYFKSVLSGFVTCFVLIILESIPLFSIFYILLFSLMESIFLFRIITHYLPMNQSSIILFSILILFYFCTVYLWAYLGNNYIGLYRQKKFRKMLEERMNEFPDIKSRMYEKYPVLPGQYQYYQTSVCSNSEERREFDTDWNHYLIYLDSSSRNITFNQFFEKQKLYQIRRYKQNAYKTNIHHNTNKGTQNTAKTNMQGGGNGTSYFAGVNDMKSLKKRYRDLLKIYHPDNQNGDTSVSKQIQEEYNALSGKYKS